MTTGTRSPFGEALRRLRLRAGLSQEQLAERARLSAESIGALERGARRAPYRHTVELLATALEASEVEREELRTTARRPRRLPGSGESSELQPETAAPAVPHNLPYEATSLRGRERDLADARALLDRSRVVTIAGAGGIGKTRVAVALAGALLGEPLDGVWFVDLAPLASSDSVDDAVAKVLGLTRTDERDFSEILAAQLAKRRGLIVLDNCEHVLEKAAALAVTLRDRCPGLRVLATSRQALGIAGEAVFRLPSLDVPQPAADLPAEEARRYGAVALFVDRATIADPGFVLDDRNAALVATVCAQLDGIALAIELAAARVNVLSLPGLAKRLTERFRLLTGGNPRALRRQRTLGALIDWSYDLLTPAERTLLNRSAIFAGGFDLDAASAVCAAEGQDAFDVLDLLGSLVDKSLVVADTSREIERFRLLESTRAYALERLDALGERATIARRHAEHFAGIAHEAEAGYGRTKIAEWLPAVEIETGNLRRALEWSLGEGHDNVLGGTMAGELVRFWINGGLEVEGRRWVALGLERNAEAEHPETVARLQRARAWLELGEVKCAAARKAAQLYERLGDSAAMGDSLRLQALAEAQLGRLDDAIATNARALALFRRGDDRRNLANCLDMAGAIATQTGDFAGAREALLEALALFRALGSEGGSASVLTSMAQLEFLTNSPERALDLVRQAQQIRRSSKYSTNFAIDCAAMATYCLALDRLDEALAHALAAVEASHQAQNVHMTLISLAVRAAVAARSDDALLAARLLGFINASASHTLERDRTEQQIFDELTASLRKALPAAQLDSLQADGALWSQEDAVRRALAQIGAVPVESAP